MHQDQNSISSNDTTALVQDYLNKVSIDEPLPPEQLALIRKQIKQLLVKKMLLLSPTIIPTHWFKL